MRTFAKPVVLIDVNAVSIDTAVSMSVFAGGGGVAAKMRTPIFRISWCDRIGVPAPAGAWLLAAKMRTLIFRILRPGRENSRELPGEVIERVSSVRRHR